MSKTFLIIGIIITSISLLGITIFSISNAILKRINKDKEKEKTAEEKRRDKTFKRVLKYTKKIIKKINKKLIEYYALFYGISAISLGAGVAMVSVSTAQIIEEEKQSISSSEVISSSEPNSSSAPSSSTSSDSVVNTYTVTWKNFDGTPLQLDTNVREGTVPTYIGPTVPVKEPTETVEYVFDGWEPAIAPVTSDITYVAKMKAQTRFYTVQWLNMDFTLLREDQYEYNAIPDYELVPSYGPDDQYVYEFDDWDRPIEAVTEDTYYKATYSTYTRTYTVRWVDDDVSHVFEIDENVEYGTMPEYNGERPEKEDTAYETYEFDGWAPEVSTVTGDIEYVAKYKATPVTHTVQWFNYNDDLLWESEVVHGQAAEYEGPSPTRAGMIFDGWDPDIDSTIVTNNCSFTATYRAPGHFALTIHNPYQPDVSIMELAEGTIISLTDLPALRGLFADPNDAHHKADQFYIDELMTEPLDINSPLASDYDVYATYYYEYRVSYMTDDDNDGIYEEVDYEDVIKDECADGNVSGYDTYKWYTSLEPDVEFDFSTPIIDDLVLYGKEYIPNSINL